MTLKVETLVTGLETLLEQHAAHDRAREFRQADEVDRLIGQTYRLLRRAEAEAEARALPVFDIAFNDNHTGPEF